MTPLSSGTKQEIKFYEKRLVKVLFVPIVLGLISLLGLGISELVGQIAEHKAQKVVCDSTVVFRQQIMDFEKASETDRHQLHLDDVNNRKEIMDELHNGFQNLNLRLDRARFPK